jgi:uncharacterized protein (DUF302 family)
MIVTESSSTFAQTAAQLTEGISRRGLTLFARIDHAAGARGAGLELPSEEVLIFGSPQAGTPLMQADPRVGYELPLRVLIWEQGGKVLVGYQDPKELADRYEIGDRAAILDQMSKLLAQLAAEAAAS